MSTLFFAPVRQDPETLALFLRALAKVDGIDAYWFINDNDDADSRRMIGNFRPAVTAITPGDKFAARSGYIRIDSGTHEWTTVLMSRMAEMRNYGLEKGWKRNYDQLFTVDSDLILHPQILNHLKSVDKPIVSEVYWSQWHPGHAWLPNVWDTHNYRFNSTENLLRLKWPGQYPVGGLGACTLIDLTKVPETVNYSPVNGVVDWPGEDRNFCIRASAHDIELTADTCYPPFHVYRKAQLEEARRWYDDGAHPGYFRKHWLTQEWEESFRRKAA